MSFTVLNIKDTLQEEHLSIISFIEVIYENF